MCILVYKCTVVAEKLAHLVCEKLRSVYYLGLVNITTIAILYKFKKHYLIFQIYITQ